MKSGILIVSFGTTYPETRKKNIAKMTECVRAAYPDALVREAVSSRIVRTVMRKREGLSVCDTGEALRGMCADGVTHVTVLPTHIIDGIENSRMRAEVEECRALFEEVRVADVLLAQPQDYEIAARALWESVKDAAGDAPVIFMGHGTAHEADAGYRRMEQALRAYSGHEIYMATVEGSVTVEDVIPRLRAHTAGGRVLVTPFMLVAGDHATNDMAGERDSIASRLRQEGYEPECVLKGIGEYAAVREIYLSHLRRARYGENAAEAAGGKGVLCGVGVGPGDPELMTVKAIRTIRGCDVLVLPAVSREECHAYQIAVRAVPEAADKEALCMAFPMIRDEGKLKLAHSRIYEGIAEHLSRGKKVAFLTIGDPTVYSTYMYIHRRAVRDGWEANIISGVPSFCAAAARLGISLGEKQEQIRVIPAAYDVGDAPDEPGVCVYMKSGKKLRELADELERRGVEEQGRTVFAVSSCGMEDERVYRGLSEVKKAEGYLTLVIVK